MNSLEIIRRISVLNPQKGDIIRIVTEDPAFYETHREALKIYAKQNGIKIVSLLRDIEISMVDLSDSDRLLLEMGSEK